jgi:hypothetical protein
MINTAVIKTAICVIPSRKLKKVLKNNATADTRQIALKMRASKEKQGGWPITFAQNDRIIFTSY